MFKLRGAKSKPRDRSTAQGPAEIAAGISPSLRRRGNPGFMEYERRRSTPTNSCATGHSPTRRSTALGANSCVLHYGRNDQECKAGGGLRSPCRVAASLCEHNADVNGTLGRLSRQVSPSDAQGSMTSVLRVPRASIRAPQSQAASRLAEGRS